MKKILLFSLLIFTSVQVFSQVTCTKADTARVEALLIKAKANDWKGLPMGDLVIRVGKEFLGTPYVAKTLEVNGLEEKLVVNFSGLDCTTFLENTVVFARIIKQGKFSFDAYLKELENVRYKGGELNGYLSRLHYFSDWIREKSELGMVTNVGVQIGETYQKSLDFMSKHRSAYTQLADDATFEAIQAYETTLKNSKISHVPQTKIEGLEHLIQDGDLIAFTTNLDGLDVTHVAIAIHQKGRLYFMHASSKSNEVEISPKTVADYVNGRKISTGIMVARLL
ncbi:DUF1460 domain-containing protein [Flammeovirgaceae bacterium SG7u.111]|nr:DUF1460 domain-containing protein [Flammeovirgaceae bacterium SG7u.132]WPO38280.1 DUF1460 domain-containing protein [Flammeovirgaceae bacterium SG7u.111]